MIKSLEERKKEYLEYIQEEYRPKPTRCWQSAKRKYIPMDEFGKKSRQYYPGSVETLIKYDIKGALFSSALFFTPLLGITIWGYYSKEKEIDFGTIVFAFIFSVYIAIHVYKNMKQPDRIKMNDHGIWLHTVNEWIEWNNMASLYIKVDSGDETTLYFLVIHFYHKEMDRFMFTEYEYRELDRKLEDAAAEIVSRKELKKHSDADKIYLYS